MTDTTTEEPVQPVEGGEQPQPEAVQPEAGTPAPEDEQPKVDEPAPADNSGPQEEFDAKTWLEKKGIDPSDPDAAAKIAKMAHESEQAMHKATSTASELKKSLETQPAAKVSTDPLVQQLYERQVKFERDTAVGNFKREVGLTPEKEAKMVNYMAEHPEKKQLVNAGYMTLQELYTLSGAGSVDPAAIKAQGKQETLQQLANKQRTAAVQGAATHRPGSQSEEDRLKDLWSN